MENEKLVVDLENKEVVGCCKKKNFSAQMRKIQDIKKYVEEVV